MSGHCYHIVAICVFCSVKTPSQATLVTPLFRYQCLPLRCYIDISIIIIYSPPALCNGYNLPIWYTDTWNELHNLAICSTKAGMLDTSTYLLFLSVSFHFSERFPSCSCSHHHIDGEINSIPIFCCDTKNFQTFIKWVILFSLQFFWKIIVAIWHLLSGKPSTSVFWDREFY